MLPCGLPCPARGTGRVAWGAESPRPGTGEGT
ncbi:hypothetical protein EFN20_05955 [Propionibacterium freudenreichii]|nr:hypothetical protein [Propionibacterium freudenreichii]PWN00422.1 MAG: hypothetical protein DBX96_00105 [Propionibacterium sp.]MCT2975300.1 hypothetical protein [Propionibacterium freudenreichii]MCT2977539.1 hypothetical protein [Propionibacterium freudenreichii]MCT2981383.1 hypothetical protein [Propionibacterium freudenreichii]